MTRHTNIPGALAYALNAISPHVPDHAPSVEVMNHFHVTIKDGAKVVREFEAMDLSHVAVQKQHEDMCDDGQQVWVDDEAEMQARAGDRARNDAKSADPFNTREADKAEGYRSCADLIRGRS